MECEKNEMFSCLGYTINGAQSTQIASHKCILANRGLKRGVRVELSVSGMLTIGLEMPSATASDLDLFSIILIFILMIFDL